MTGKLLGIALTSELRAPMQEQRAAGVSVEAGMAGDARGKKEGRQITVLFREGWEDACKELGVTLPWITRRANLYVEGIDRPHGVGGHISVGNVVLQITQETKPCMLMEHFHKGLKAALTPEWRGGVCCRVVTGGTLQVGDTVNFS